jgi:UDP-4-amino-4,6-dideoxy-N-acetyl-beta-L-altrosamine N-acetyltransferase
MVRGWRNSPEVSAYMYNSFEISPEEQLKWYQKIKNDNSSRYWIIEVSGRPIGVASLSGISKLFNSCYWAFYLGDTEIRGGGIGSKVEYQVLNYVFEDLGLNKLRCEVFSFNEKVIQLHEKFGFRREAYYRQHIFKDGSFRDVVGLALLKSEWIMIKDKMKIKIYGE